MDINSVINDYTDVTAAQITTSNENLPPVQSNTAVSTTAVNSDSNIGNNVDITV